MSTRGNSLQAALAGAAVADEPEQKPKQTRRQQSKVAAKKRTPAGQSRAVTTAKPAAKQSKSAKADTAEPAATAPSGRYRDSTVMVGGHFPPHVLRQLRMIAAEEDTTNQALIAEALDLLFVKKGKGKIGDLSAG
jgi:hypothetical protein